LSKPDSQLSTNADVIKRLDALIRLFIEMNKPSDKRKFTEGDAARLLKSVDLTPTEIAKILGKNSATHVAPYLYAKKKPAEKNNQEKQMTSQEITKETEGKQ